MNRFLKILVIFSFLGFTNAGIAGVIDESGNAPTKIVEDESNDQVSKKLVSKVIDKVAAEITGKIVGSIASEFIFPEKLNSGAEIKYKKVPMERVGTDSYE